MGEGIDIYNKGIARNNGHSGKSAFQKQFSERVETVRAEVSDSLKPLIGTSVRVKGKRKEIDVVIDRDSIKHIANDIALGRIPKGLGERKNLINCIESSTQESVSLADRSGIHTKVKKVKDFRYFSFKHNGEIFYANVAGVSTGTNKNTKMEYRLHTITRNLKE